MSDPNFVGQLARDIADPSKTSPHAEALTAALRDDGARRLRGREGADPSKVWVRARSAFSGDAPPEKINRIPDKR